jgi:signal peptidase I
MGESILTNFNVGDIVVINANAYEGAFEDDVGVVVECYLKFCYVLTFKHNDRFLFKNDEVEYYNVSDR